MQNKEYAKQIDQITEWIEHDQFDQVRNLFAQCIEESSGQIDDRFRAEMLLALKAMEYKQALKEFDDLRAFSAAFRYCENQYASAGILQEKDDEYLPNRDVIWWCWSQGIESAPPLVRCCYESLKKLGKEIIVLDEENIPEYVTLPDFIMEKYRSGSFGKAHFSDLLRLELLTKRGGVWIDSTVWLSGTDQIKRVLDQADLFMFRSGQVSQYIIFDSWMMQAKTKSRLLEATRRMLYAYWEKENTIRNYFLLHLMMTVACKMYLDEYEKVPVFSNEPCHVLQYELNDRFDIGRWKQITGMSDVHKLTYRISESEEHDTFLNHLLSGGISCDK